MVWSTFAALVSGKRPVWLYEVTVDGIVNRLTTRRGGYTYGGNSYSETALRHSNIRQTQAINRAEVSLIFPRTNTLAASIRDTLNGLETRVVIRTGDENDPDQEFRTFFDGRIIATRPNLTAIDLVCENRFTAFRRKAIGAIMQRPCRHALYFGGCGLNKEDFYTAGTATAISGDLVTVTEAALQADHFYTMGLIRFNGVEQMVRRHTGDTLRLYGPLTGLADEIATSGSAAVEISPGCNRSLTDCAEKFSNHANFGGFPFMTDNPFDGRILF